MIDIIQSDSNGTCYDKHLLHFSIRCLDTFAKKFGSLINAKMYAHVAEFFCNVCGM